MLIGTEKEASLKERFGGGAGLQNNSGGQSMHEGQHDKTGRRSRLISKALANEECSGCDAVKGKMVLGSEVRRQLFLEVKMRSLNLNQ